MSEIDNPLPGAPRAGKVACLLVLLGLLALALAAIGVVNWKVGRGVPDKTMSTVAGVHDVR